MLKATVTSKGQITLPAELRRQLGVREGDELVFEPVPGGLLVRKASRVSRFARYRGYLAGSGERDGVAAARALRDPATDEGSGA